MQLLDDDNKNNAAFLIADMLLETNLVQMVTSLTRFRADQACPLDLVLSDSNLLGEINACL